MVKFIIYDLIWDYLDDNDFSYYIGGALIRELDDDDIEHLHYILNNPHRDDNEGKYRRLAILLNPDV